MEISCGNLRVGNIGGGEMMLTLDDAVKVAKKLFHECFDNQDEGYEEMVRSEFEQKCYLESRDHESRLLEVINEINPQAICLEIGIDGLQEWCEGMRAELEMAYTRIKETAPAREWVSVMTRLPEDSKPKVVLRANGLMEVDQYEDEGWFYDDVLAWMSIPEPYKEESEDVE